LDIAIGYDDVIRLFTEELKSEIFECDNEVQLLEDPLYKITCPFVAPDDDKFDNAIGYEAVIKELTAEVKFDIFVELNVVQMLDPETYIITCPLLAEELEMLVIAIG